MFDRDRDSSNGMSLLSGVTEELFFICGDSEMQIRNSMKTLRNQLKVVNFKLLNVQMNLNVYAMCDCVRYIVCESATTDSFGYLEEKIIKKDCQTSLGVD